MSLYEELMKKAQEERYKLTLQHSRNIQKLYQDVADDILKELKGMKGTSRAYRNQYMKVVRQRLRHLNKEIEEAVRRGVNQTANTATEVNRKWFEEIGHKYNIDIPKEMYKSLFSIPQREIDTILNGDLYKTGKGISDNVWKYSKDYEKNVNYILAKGIAEKKSYRELAKELSGYAKGKNTSYKAMRLIRTSMNHAFQLSCIDNAKKNPFAEAIHWNLSSQHFARQVNRFGTDICDTYANQDDYKLGVGNFPKGEVPVAHPNCMCYLTVVIPKSLDEIADELNKWLKGGKNTTLDNWYSNITGKEINKENKLNSIQNISNKEYTKAIDLSANMKGLNVTSYTDRRKLGKDILKVLDLTDIPVHIIKMKANGYCEARVIKTFDVKSYNLDSGDIRAEKYKIKTAFHEAFHAKGNGFNTDFAIYRDQWTEVEETFAESSAHFLAREVGLGEISPSYAEKLYHMLPRLKQMDEFKRCKTIADFGEVAWEKRLTTNSSEWKELYDEIMEKEFNINDYIKNYEEYINNNKEELVEQMLENMPRYKVYKPNMVDDCTNALDKLSKNKHLTSNENMVIKNILCIAMNRKGIL